jgi:hypothetical protein
MWDELLIYLCRSVAASCIMQIRKIRDLNIISVICITYLSQLDSAFWFVALDAYGLLTS